MKKTVEELSHRYPGIVELLDPLLVERGRAVGNTTRHVDKAVQLLMKGFPILIHDPYEGGNNGDANRYLFEKIVERMHHEHRKCKMTLDKSNLVIQLQTLIPTSYAKF